jgi:hypothetical protein
MINEELNKSDLRKIKSLIKKEIDLFKKKDLEDKIKVTVKSNFKDIEELDNKFDDKVEKITKEVLQAFYDLMYREKYIMKRKVKR